MKKIFAWYVRTPLVVLNIAAFVLGCVGGLLVWKLGVSRYSVASDWIISVLQPFGNVLIFMLKMIVVPSVVFASVGAGGVPGGSIFLLFMVLDCLKLSPEQSAMIVALALGINPLLDMFETACNVAGDNVGTYIISKRLKMIEAPPGKE